MKNILFTLMDAKALTAIINAIHLQNSEYTRDYITLSIVLKETAIQSGEYSEFIEAVKKLLDLNVEIEDTHKKVRYFSKFITRVDWPSGVKDKQIDVIYIDMIKEVVERLSFIRPASTYSIPFLF